MEVFGTTLQQSMTQLSPVISRVSFVKPDPEENLMMMMIHCTTIYFDQHQRSNKSPSCWYSERYKYSPWQGVQNSQWNLGWSRKRANLTWYFKNQQLTKILLRYMICRRFKNTSKVPHHHQSSCAMVLSVILFRYQRARVPPSVESWQRCLPHGWNWLICCILARNTTKESSRWCRRSWQSYRQENECNW